MVFYGDYGFFYKVFFVKKGEKVVKLFFIFFLFVVRF